MNIPTITSIETALLIYYKHSEIGNKEITVLFGRRSSATISKLKRIVKDEMNKKGVPSYGANKVNTITAFSVWGLDVSDMEKRSKKLKELNL
jgi:hypothetical protein